MRELLKLRDGVELSYELRRHPSPVLPGLVVLVHGRLHTATRGPCAQLIGLLPFDVLTFDARGMGESGGETGWNNVSEEVEDLKELLQHVTQSADSPRDRILALVGHSKGAVVVLTLASSPFFAALPSSLPAAQSPTDLTSNAPLPPFVISLSARYDTSSLSPSGLSRFTASQIATLEAEGRFTWLHYRAGPEPDRPERRAYVVTGAAIESAKTRNLACVEKMAQGTQVLLLHGRADGTVPEAESRKVDEKIKKGGATSDLVLTEGVEHNWDGDGEIEMVAGVMVAWMKGRARRPARRPTEMVDHLGLDRKK